MRSLRPILFSPFLILLAAFPLAAQIDRAVLTGTVTDPAGAVVPGAKVTAVSVETGVSRDAVTNSDGVYIIPALLVGRRGRSWRGTSGSIRPRSILAQNAG